ncbi:MAG: pseudouridine synthase [Lachnospiraceae bacterium]|nr:pseudouridine synthase [Lachnospiraceae bacterium]
MEDKGIRINKYLAECGICSRRNADELIDKGLVTVNGKPAVNGMKIYPEMEIYVKGQKVKGIEDKVYLAFNKPKGIVCTAEKMEENNVIDYLNYPVRITYSGRLDKDSEGLLIMTNDGDLIDAMMRSRNEHEKEYIVTVNRTITDADLYKMSKGVYLWDLKVTTKSCKIKRISDNSFSIILTQGLNRQIRRMLRTFDYHVKKLVRVRVMNIELGELETGKYRELKADEINRLFKMCNIDKNDN